MTGSRGPLLREEVTGVELLRRPSSGGPSLILLHGVGSDAASWEPTLTKLDPRIDAIAWNAPGYGRSTPLAIASPHPRDYAARLAAVLEGLRLDRVFLAGHSLGALFAASFAATWPERVAALALLSPAAGYRVPSGEPLPANVQARIDELERLGPQVFAAARSARLVFRPETKPAALAGVQRAMSAVHPEGYAQAVRALGAGDLMADAARIVAPTLIAVGAQDVLTPPSGARAIFAALNRAVRFVEIADAAHAFPQEVPTMAASLLAELVDAGEAATNAAPPPQRKE